MGTNQASFETQDSLSQLPFETWQRPYHSLLLCQGHGRSSILLICNISYVYNNIDIIIMEVEWL